MKHTHTWEGGETHTHVGGENTHTHTWEGETPTRGRGNTHTWEGETTDTRGRGKHPHVGGRETTHTHTHVGGEGNHTHTGREGNHTHTHGEGRDTTHTRRGRTHTQGRRGTTTPPAFLLSVPFFQPQRRAAAGAQQQEHGKLVRFGNNGGEGTYDVLCLHTGYEPKAHDFDELQNSLVPPHVQDPYRGPGRG